MFTAGTRSAHPLGDEGHAVAEVLGLEGPYSFPEKLLQQIWLRREFDARQAATTDGRPVRVTSTGRWNLLGGPDFKDARIMIGDERVHGDVEVHLRAADWMAHGHSKDPAYDRVVLHVVLFPSAERATPGRDGRGIPILCLLPLLYHDLEEYAADAAVAGLAHRPSVRIVEALGALTAEERLRLLTAEAEARWRQKVRFACVRLERLGWEQACHQSALEILGYRYNRVPMLRVATVHRLSCWLAKGFDPEAVYAEDPGVWQRQGVRPANHPRMRLRQYARWVQAAPVWPETLRNATRGWADLGWGIGLRTAEARRTAGMRSVRDRVAEEVCGGAVSGTRLDTLVCDGFLPLLAASGDLPERVARTWWGHWFEGDVPARLHRGLRDLALMGETRLPACHGLVQGLLGWLIEDERKESSKSVRVD